MERKFSGKVKNKSIINDDTLQTKVKKFIQIK